MMSQLVVTETIMTPKKDQLTLSKSRSQLNFFEGKSKSQFGANIPST